MKRLQMGEFKMKLRAGKIDAVLLTTIIFVTLAACRKANVYLESQSPDRRSILKISTIHHGTPDYHISIKLIEGSEESEILYVRDDSHPGFSEIAWKEDSVAFLVCDQPGGPYTLGGVRVRSRAKLPETIARSMMNRAIYKRYGPSAAALKTYGNDAVNWACSDEEPLRMYSHVHGKSRISPTLSIE